MLKEKSSKVTGNNYSVYIHTNKINGKKYVGITRQNPKRRWQKGCGYDRTYFGNAIKKYGWDGFTHEVVAEKRSEKDACELEIALIKYYKTNQREYGYNISAGGETCDVITGKTGEQHPNHQRVRMIDPETKEVLRIFGAQAEAARELGISRKGITKACMGVGTATYKGYIWEYVDKDYKKPGNPGVGNYDHTVRYKKITLIEPDGRSYTFPSIGHAAEALGIKRSNISRYLRGLRKDASGRRWCYA